MNKETSKELKEKADRPHPEELCWRIRESHPFMKKIYEQGGCFSFYLILASVFPQSVPYMDGGHIYTWIKVDWEDEGAFYDINGRHDRLNVKRLRPLRNHNRSPEQEGWGMSNKMWELYNKGGKSRDDLMKRCLTG